MYVGYTWHALHISMYMDITYIQVGCFFLFLKKIFAKKVHLKSAAMVQQQYHALP